MTHPLHGGATGAYPVITILFLHNQNVLANTSVRYCSVDHELHRETDARGQVMMELAPGMHWFKVDMGADHELVVARVDSNQDLCVVQVHVSGKEPEEPAPREMRERLGSRYKFGRVLGRGGAGVVFKATDTLLKRRVAIKVLRNDITRDEETHRLFLQEARRLAHLSHGNLIALHDVATFDGEIVMITEYVRGTSLDVMLREQGALPEDLVVKVAIQLARAISYLHAREYIHRDIKPSNIMLQPDGTLKLIDFGLACAVEDITKRRERVYGTPAYMAPEHLMGKRIDARADLFQLGVTLYELACGQRPFPETTLTQDISARHASPLLERAPTLPPRLAALIHACLEPDPDARLPSGGVLLERLQSLYLQSASAPARRPRPRPIHIAALLAITILSFACGVWWSQHYLPTALAGIVVPADTVARH